MAMSYFARWSGPVKETDDPYNPYSAISPPGLTADRHVQEVIILPSRANYTDNNIIKQAIMTHGAVRTSMYWDNPYYKSSTKAYYYNSSASGTNHGVAIVGWNDNYSSSNFQPSPPGNGAFIIKNSWGTGWGESGFFYISYYDTNAMVNNFVYTSSQPAANLSRVYQYDPLGWTSSLSLSTLGCPGETAWFSNIFLAEASERVSAVSFYTAVINSSYTIRIYTNVTTDPTSGSLSGSTSGTIATVGYHTIALPQTIPVTAGQKFSVVAQLSTPGFTHPVAIETPISGYTSKATANAGESYISCNASAWTDLTAIIPNTNVCLKAFAATAPSNPSVKIMETSTYYSAIQNAYISAAANQSIRMQSLPFIENLNLTGNINVYLKGGYDSSFESNPGLTSINGSLIISGGTVSVENIIIK
jgi:hypothetical protein